MGLLSIGKSRESRDARVFIRLSSRRCHPKSEMGKTGLEQGGQEGAAESLRVLEGVPSFWLRGTRQRD